MLDLICNFFSNGWLSLSIFIFTILFAVIWQGVISVRHKRDRKVTFIRILFVGTFISAVLYFLPIMKELLGGQEGREFWIDSILTSAQFAFRLFILDGEILWIFDEKLALFNDPAVKNFYTLLGSILYFIAPILTFSFVLTFFNNLFSKVLYLIGVFCPTHVFSELNEKSVALATDLKKKSFWNIIVFAEISEKICEEKMELVEDAHMIGAIMFNKDFDSIKFKHEHSPRNLYFYLISDDEEKKLRHAEVVMKNFDYDKVELRLFSSDIRSQLLMDSFNPIRMRSIRIDDIQTLVYHNLYTNGKKLFERARTIDEKGDKVISAVIVGLGQYGREMLKALTWFCQLKGYKIKITAFDSDEKAEKKFKFMCPELMDDKYNGATENYTRVEGEPYYEIRIFGGVDVSTPAFKKYLEEIKDATYVFVCLGNDEINLKTAVDIRSMSMNINYVGDGHKPDIETVIYNSRLASSIRTSWEAIVNGRVEGVTTCFKKQNYYAYNILVTGDLESFYSVSTLINSDLINAGIQVQLGYDAGNDPEKKKDPTIIQKSVSTFWRYEYNYNSSTAKAIHLKLRREMKCSPKEYTVKEWDKLPLEKKIEHVNPEHIRWSAYMRSRGYSKTTNYDENERNDLGKRHHCLIPTHKLGEKDLRKD